MRFLLFYYANQKRDGIDSRVVLWFDRPMILQFMVGEMVISKDDPRVSDDDYNVTLFGVAAQKPFYGEISQVGIETGGLFNWKSETRDYAASGGGGGGTIAISTEH